MPKKHVIPSQNVETIGVYKITPISHGFVIYRDEDGSSTGQFRISPEVHDRLFDEDDNSIYVVAYVDDDAVLQIFPDVEIEDCYW